MKYEEPRNLSDFWLIYVNEHRHPWNRYLHFAGTSLTLFFLGAAFFTGQFVWLIAVPLAGYSFAWVGHFMMEKNKPATFHYPHYSLLSDYRMFFFMLTGRMTAEVERAKARYPSKSSF